MKYLKITLRPLDAYFLGGERNFAYGEEVTQLSQRKPYFIRSNRMLSQTAAFGALRYLGIRNPQTSYDISADGDNIGLESYRLTAQKQTFGRIHHISPVLLQDEKKRRYTVVPRNRKPVSLSGDERKPFLPFDTFSPVRTLDGVRYLPESYDEKKAYDGGTFLCLEDGQVIGSPFSSQVRTGINRLSQRNGSDNEPGGFFKKEYILLQSGFAFLFYAQVEDDFFFHRDTVVYMGQGRTPFAAHAEETIQREQEIALPLCCHPTEARRWESATALSDLYLPGSTDSLKGKCSLMIAGSSTHRTFITNHSTDGARSRYTKGRESLKLICAGSVFLFLGTEDQTPAQQAEIFRNYICQGEQQRQAEIAGFNSLYFTIPDENGGN